MSNSIECAFPILETETGINFHPGLTKREYFAGLAPDKIPQWFNQVFAESMTNPEFSWSIDATDYSIGECGFTPRGQAAIYFAWRAYYADNILKELDK